MHQPVDNGDDASRVRKHFAPFGKWAVGGDNRRLEFITAVDDVEQQIGMAVSVGEVPDFIDDQYVWMRIVFQPAPQCVVAILSRQVAVIRKQSLIINLPGQPKSIAETLEGLRDVDGNSKVAGIFAAVPYCIDLIGGPYLETHDAVCKAFRPKNAVRKTA